MLQRPESAPRAANVKANQKLDVVLRVASRGDQASWVAFWDQEQTPTVWKGKRWKMNEVEFARVTRSKAADPDCKLQLSPE